MQGHPLIGERISSGVLNICFLNTEVRRNRDTQSTLSVQLHISGISVLIIRKISCPQIYYP